MAVTTTPSVSLQAIIDNLVNIAGKFIPSDDERLHPEQIEFWIHQYRAKLMMQFTDFGKDIANQLWQDLGVIPLTRVDKSEDSALKWGAYTKKLAIPLPKLIEFPLNRGLWVGAIDKTTGWVVTTPDVVQWKIRNKLAAASGIKWVYTIHQSLYVVSCQDVDWCNIRGIFSDPSNACYYNSDGTARCYDEVNDEYPVPDAMRDTITQQILMNELNAGKVIREEADDPNAATDTKNK